MTDNSTQENLSTAFLTKMQRSLTFASLSRDYEAAFDYDQLPSHMVEALNQYIAKGVPLGGFLEAVVSNDLGDACGRADSTNLWLIPVYAAWLYNNAPSTCHGSRDRYDRWLNEKAAERKAALAAGE